MDEDRAALGGGAFGNSHLAEAILAQGIERGGLGGAVAADEARVAGRVAHVMHAHELAFVIGGRENAVIVEIDRQRVDGPRAAGVVGALDLAQAQHRG